MTNYKKPAKLISGDRVAIVSPSWGGPSVFPQVYENGLKVLKEWGLEIVEYPAARMDAGFLRAHPPVRAQDINEAFANPDIKAIFTSIGGDDSARILPFLNQKIIAANPKILLGFSDTSTLHVLANQQGLVTLYGPSIMAGFSQMANLPTSFKLHLRTMLFEPQASYEYAAYHQYCDGYPDWAEPANLGQVKTLKENDGWHWLQGSTVIQGELFGGCLEVLEMMKATEFWPTKDFWVGKIFFLETSEEKPSLHEVDHVLRNYGLLGIFDQINGFIFSRARDYSAGEKKQLEEKIVTIISQEFGRPDLPIITNFDVGHTDPQLVLPLGVKAEIDCQAKKIKLVEPWLI
jgi:muramoyltetrapeptide carboxypeptidase LdcA involved in peptidoglycan recycling